MKHAYLILAHNEYPILERLIKAIDDPRNDIYIHFDGKVKDLPKLETVYSDLFIVENRIDVRWGDVSVIEAEYLLFEEALKKGGYDYYHLLSGVDMPLKSQNRIHAFFDMHRGKEFIGFYQYPINEEIDRKMNRIHLFPKDFRPASGVLSFTKKLIRFGGLKIQYITGYRRNKSITFKKGTQWVSLTEDFIKYVVERKTKVLNIYKNTFCSDEVFLQTLCWSSDFKNNLFNSENEGLGCMRMIGWRDGVLYDWENKDYESLMQSEFLFARKFNSKNLEVVDKILSTICQDETYK
ncbi:beta-1,6-N-acetylglucosaminyltransferase [Elizabethkingia anophelis]|uniref:beta-1,6-N-acetylglucosaminyltransferase n=1 Tax=Elizabethkingia anophelis TaxID=1117645 RepID=UPI000C6E07AB|nr:beta-1,6-N-acetylglucosaminyltransferase [Elizabethkingia anophelis]PKR31982.1 glycosyl transferase [Elizabethkingia anophelis]PKR34854.1 glycosyl transferase [Elizabethkingia anophelis]PRQ78552.1 glycosyl transferase [Elizabethkingia anophelis]PRQ83446.1 glycosyl transferase [Elizabethkingia anophelis]PRQ86403.1 glycosyl transferase [Elizabethkingia anophelis]